MACTVVSLFASQDFVSEVSFCVPADFVLFAEVDLVSLLILGAFESVSEFSFVHSVLVAVTRIHSIVESRRELVLNVFLEMRLLLQSHIFVLVIDAEFLVELAVLIVGDLLTCFASIHSNS